MIQLLTRQQFVEYWSEQCLDAIGPASYFWLPETEIVPGPGANYFVLAGAIFVEYEEKQKYWRWCDEHLEYPVRCYYSGDEEVWGFVSQNDAILWLLKFSCTNS